VYPPSVGLVYFGDAAVRVVASTDDPDLVPNPEGEVIQAGAVGPAALSLHGPDSESERHDLERTIKLYREWLDVHLDHHVATRGLADIAGSMYFYAFDGYFPLVQLLEQRLLWGPPGDPPVPAFDEVALGRAAELVRPATDARRREVLAALRGPKRGSAEQSHATLAAAGWTVQAAEGEAEADDAHVFAMFTAQGWTIVLRDDLAAAPFGSYCGIDLVPPEGGPAVSVMMVDAWNPQTRTVVDGDAFAFRRFVAWLRAAILRGGHDEVRTFAPADEDDADEEDDEGSAAVEITISDWLLFGMPDTGDRFLVDWRAQWHIVHAVGGSEGFAGIYGFTGAYLEKLRDHDVVQWRRFLHEVIDPRFPATDGRSARSE
jgi:hypothetical protein